MKFALLHKSLSSTNLSSNSSNSSFNTSNAPELPALPFPTFSTFSNSGGSNQSSNHASISSNSDWSMIDASSRLSEFGGLSSQLNQSVNGKKESKKSNTNESNGSSTSSGFGKFVKRVRSASMGSSSNKKLAKEKVLPLPPLPYSLGVSSKGIGSADFIPRTRKLSKPLNEFGFQLGNNSEISIGTTGIPCGEDAFDHQPPSPRQIPTEEEDLASLLYLVHAAGDKFASEGKLSNSPPTSPRTPPVISTTTKIVPASSLSKSTSNTPKSSYLSFLSPVISPLTSPVRTTPTATTSSHHLPTPPLSPLRNTSFPASRDSNDSNEPNEDEESEDEYGEAFENDKSNSSSSKLWSRTPNSSFAKALTSIDNLNPLFSTGTLPVTNTKERKFPEKGKGLGPIAKEILEITIQKLTNVEHNLSDGNLRRPLSINLMNEVIKFADRKGMRVVLGRILIRKKLKRGLTMLEGIELERSKNATTASPRKFISNFQSELEPEESQSSSDILNPFSVTTSSTNSISTLDTPIFPKGMSTPTTLSIWLSRPSYIQRNLVTIAVEGGLLIDLIRCQDSKRKKNFNQSLEFSNRIKSWSQTKLISDNQSSTNSLTNSNIRNEFNTNDNEVEVLAGEEKPTRSLSERRGSLPLSVLPIPSSSHLLNSSTLLHSTLSNPPKEDQEEEEEEEDIPLAYLRQRSSTSVTTPSTPSSLQYFPNVTNSNTSSPRQLESEALRKAQEKSSQLEEEVMRMRIQQLVMKENQLRIDNSRFEDEKIKENLRKEEEILRREGRRLADEKRRRRAMGFVDENEASGGQPKVVRINDGVEIRRANSPTPSYRNNSPKSTNLGNSSSGENFPPSSSTSNQSQFLNPNQFDNWTNQLYYQSQFQAYTMMPMPMFSPPQTFYSQPQISRSAPDLQQLFSNNNHNQIDSISNLLSPNNMYYNQNYYSTPTPPPQFYNNRPSSPSPSFQSQQQQFPIDSTNSTNNKYSPRRSPLSPSSNHSNIYNRPSSSASLLPPSPTSSKNNRRISTSSQLLRPSTTQSLRASPSTPNLNSIQNSNKQINRNNRDSGVSFLNSAGQKLKNKNVEGDGTFLKV